MRFPFSYATGPAENVLYSWGGAVRSGGSVDIGGGGV